MRNANEPQLGEPESEPHAPVRVVWPVVPSSATAAPASESSADAKTQTALLLPAEADSIAGEADPIAKVDTEEAARPAEGTTGSRPVARLAVLLFLLLGLPGAGILAWIVVRADHARGAQMAGEHLRPRRAGGRSYDNKRRVGSLDSTREADWLDSFLARLAKQPRASVWNAGHAAAEPVAPRTDVTEVVLRDVMIALRNKAAAKHGSGRYAAKATAATR